jgi:ankyrin repeat protein
MAEPIDSIVAPAVSIAELVKQSELNNKIKVEHLIKNLKIDPNSRDADYSYFSALDRAAEKGHIEMLQLLVDLGADLLDSKNDREESAVFRTVSSSTPQLEALKFFIKKLGDDTVLRERAGKSGETLAHRAAWKGHLNILEFLAEREKFVKPSPATRIFNLLDAVDTSGSHPLDLAKLNGHVECVKFLEKHVLQKLRSDLLIVTQVAEKQYAELNKN